MIEDAEMYSCDFGYQDNQSYHSSQQHQESKNKKMQQQDHSQHYKKSTKITYSTFKDLFAFEENERDKKKLKKDFKKIEKENQGQVKFKHLIDYYLQSSEEFGQKMKEIDAKKILLALESEEHEEGFNERLLKLICVNQAIIKFQKELFFLQEVKNNIIDSFEENEPSEKLSVFLNTIKTNNSPAMNENNEIDKNIQHIDLKLSNMMQFMNDFAMNFKTQLRDSSLISGGSHQQQFRPSSSSNFMRPSSSGYRAGQLTTHVWPKSRMLFAIVSKMSKEGFLNEMQRGVLKDLILDYDQRVLSCLQEYEIGGDREKLYYNLIQIANG